MLLYPQFLYMVSAVYCGILIPWCLRQACSLDLHLYTPHLWRVQCDRWQVWYVTKSPVVWPMLHPSFISTQSSANQSLNCALWVPPFASVEHNFYLFLVTMDITTISKNAAKKCHQCENHTTASSATPVTIADIIPPTIIAPNLSTATATITDNLEYPDK